MLREATGEGDPYRAALIDMQMPKLDGEELGRLIKADPDCGETVLVMMTSLGLRGDARRLRDVGFAAYLSKPIRQAQLHDCLALILGGEQRGEPSRPAALITRHTLSETSKHRARILLAEDDAANQRIALTMIRKLGYQAEVAATGRDALQALQAVPYDLVLMDCHMPDMDGFETTRRIRDPRSGVANHKVPVIAMTALAMKGDREECLRAGMNDYLSKPIKPQALADVLEKWLARETGADQAEPHSFPPDRRLPTAGDPAAQAIPVFDEKALYDRLTGDEEMVGMIIEEFLSYMPDELRELRELVKEGKAELAGRQAHKIKGAAATVGGEILREAAEAMEQAGRDGDLEQLQGLISSLEMQFSRLAAAMRGRKS
jgi:CheY-like chemotaxis protein/HPt (histidine-containing phosphotransfer) domain-containing protein